MKKVLNSITRDLPYAKANNKYMPNYDKKIHTLSIMIFAISIEGLYRNHRHVVDFNLLKIYQ